MKAKWIVFVSFVFLAFFLSGCANTEAPQKANADTVGTPDGTQSDDRSSSIADETSGDPQKNEDNSMVSGDIEIYQIGRDAFSDFLESNSGSDLRSKAKEHYRYSENGENYQTSAVTLFKVKKEFIDFAGSQEAVQDYLAQWGFYGDIEDMLVFDAEHTPKAIWVKTSAETVFITVNEDLYFEEGYVYRIYSRSAFCEKFKCRDGRLIVDGKDITNGKTVKMYHSYADLPFTAICTALGAEIKWESETVAEITCKGKVYRLDTENMSLTRNGTKENLFRLCGGGNPYYKYTIDGELYMDSGTVASVLLGMEQDVYMEHSNEIDTVSIIKR